VEASRLGHVVRTLRIRSGIRQSDLAAVAGVSQTMVSRIERGHLREISIGALLRIAEALGMTIDWVPRWRGGDLDRMLNAGHAAMDTSAAELLGRLRWLTAPETTFSVYGERGSIDILAFHAPTGSLLVIELKTDLVDLSGLLTAVDRYRRLAPQLAERLGWNVRTVSTWVLFRDSATNRRRVAEHAGVLRTAFPLNGNQMRSWLAKPSGAVAGLSFIAIGASGRRGTGVRRVRVRRDGAQSIKSAAGDS
jgi:HTH-type transcriptional regulator/antitoxin HipB